MARALRSALDVAASLDAVDQVHADRRFTEYLDQRASYYALETRWPDAPFWARRRPGDWRAAPLTLSPEATIAWASEPANADYVEALLPPRVIAAVRTALVTPQPAHAVLARLRQVAPLGDRRLLVGLQQLIDAGAIDVAVD